MTTSSSSHIPDMSGRTVIVTGANSGIGAAAASALAGAGARVVLAVRNTDKGRAAAAGMPARPRCAGSISRASPRCASSPRSWDGEIDLLINNAGVMVAAAVAHRGGLRAAVRHQPPRPLRAHQSAARAGQRARGDGLLGRAPHRQHRLRRPQLGAPAVQGAGARTASRSSPTCCSPPSCSAASPRPAPRSSPPPRIPATPPPTCSSTAAGGSLDLAQRAGQSPDRPGRARAARCRRCTRPSPTSRATAIAGPGGFMEQRGPAEARGAHRARPRTWTRRAACGMSRRSSPEFASRSAPPSAADARPRHAASGRRPGPRRPRPRGRDGAESESIGGVSASTSRSTCGSTRRDPGSGRAHRR